MFVLIPLAPKSKQFYKTLSSLHKKKIWKRAKIFISAGQAKVAPPISSILGQFGINLLDFCDKFNLKTRHLNPELSFLVSVVVYTNKTFSFVIKPISLNEIYFSLRIEDSSNNSTGIGKNRELFLVNIYKLYIIYLYTRGFSPLEINIFSKNSVHFLNQIFGYLRTHNRLKSIL